MTLLEIESRFMDWIVGREGLGTNEDLLMVSIGG